MLLAFRYVSDSRVAFPGWWVDDIRLGGATLSGGRSLAGWRSFSRVSPGERLGGFSVQLVGYTTKAKRAYIHRLQLDGRLRGRLSGAPLRKILSGGYDVVAAIVTYDEPTEAEARVRRLRPPRERDPAARRLTDAAPAWDDDAGFWD